MLPFGKIRFGTVKMETFTGNLGQVFLFHGKGCLVKVFHIQILEDMAAGNITEQGNLILQVLI